MCVYFDGSNEVLRFKEGEKIPSLKIPESIGKVYTISSKGVLLISGDKGCAIFDHDFRCLCEIPQSNETSP